METLQDVLNEIDAIETKIADLKEQSYNLHDKAISLAPFKRGDKVIVTESGNSKYPKDKETICFVAMIEFKDWLDKEEQVHYNFNKMRIDGTMAQVSAGIYSYKSIRLFDEKNNP